MIKYAISFLICALLSINYIGIPFNVLPEQVYLLALGLGIAYIYPNIFGLYVVVGSILTAFVLPEFNNPYSIVQEYKLVAILWLPVVLLACWRSAGLGFLITTIVFFLYAAFGYLLPEPFTAYKLNILKLSEFLILDSTSMLGTSLNIACTTVFIFILLGVFLQHINLTGVIDSWLIRKLANTRANGAKVAILSSAAFGMVSGSAVANVVAAGHMTIPLMIKTGYSRVVAASIEAVSSTMGQVTPPVMGAAAFLMVSFTGVPYGEIALAASIPAVLLYAMLLLYVHFTSQKIIKLEVPTEKLKFPKLKSVIMDTAELMSQMIILGAVVGILTGILDQTGIMFNLTNDLIREAGSRGVSILVVTALSCLIMGLGMPTTTTYLLMAIMLGPSLVASGFDVLASHLFILYYSCVSMVTPPVALASMSAANIAGANQTKTAIVSFIMSLPFMVIPFAFIYWPWLLLR